MGGPAGTSLKDPVTVEQKPDLRAGLHEIQEYFQQQSAYDVFDYLLKDLLINQPKDPLDHMLKCLSSEVPTGPLKVIISSAPGMGRMTYARRLADHFGLEHISAGSLLKEAGVDVTNVGQHSYNHEEKAAQLVIERMNQCHEQMKGWVLDGFPRTRFQASFLKENSVVPTHVLVLEASADDIRVRHQRILDGEIEGDYMPPDMLENKLRLHSCHSEVALETYKSTMHIIDTQPGEEFAWQHIERTVRMLPRSHGPQPPPRVVILGPRGVGAREHASLLAARLGAVFVDGNAPLGQASKTNQNQSRQPSVLGRSRTTMDMPNVQPMIDLDKLGEVGVRLRCPDCLKQGFVLCNVPSSTRMAKLLSEDVRLAPTRVVKLAATAETCIARLRHVLTDPITGKVWTTVPKNPELRKRVKRDPEDQPTAVQADYDEYMLNLPDILEALGGDRVLAEIQADEPPQAIFRRVVEFVERPLPLPPRS
mmetsp:Transcript_70548/g.181874  ORF Transcript_70548/g.181874 Transcript_70548/m.181874 type:complete len:479 (-) Transcript_70548:21-1457(-)